MEQPRKPRVDARLVFALVAVAIPVLYLVAQVILVRSGEDCSDDYQAGSLAQLFVAGVGCPVEPHSR